LTVKTLALELRHIAPQRRRAAARRGAGELQADTTRGNACRLRGLQFLISGDLPMPLLEPPRPAG
jgi:hypothetical protein